MLDISLLSFENGDGSVLCYGVGKDPPGKVRLKVVKAKKQRSHTSKVIGHTTSVYWL